MDLFRRMLCLSLTQPPEPRESPGPRKGTPFRDTEENDFSVLPFHNIDLNASILDPKFYLFPLLPTEIRIKIWIFSHPAPRNVRVTLGNRSKQNSPRLPPPRPRNCLAYLHVNNECRAIFLEHYERIFTYTQSTKPRGKGGGRYFNFEKDSLVVSSGLKGLRYLLHRFPEDMAKIRYLDVNADSRAKHRGQLFTWGDCPLQLSDLSELKLVTLRWVNFEGFHYQTYGYLGHFADTLEVLQKALRHQHPRKDCEKERSVTLAMSCIFKEKERNFREFKHLYSILFPLEKDIRERWGRMEEMLFEGPGGMMPRWGWNCKSGEIDLHQDWSRSLGT